MLTPVLSATLLHIHSQLTGSWVSFTLPNPGPSPDDLERYSLHDWRGFAQKLFLRKPFQTGRSSKFFDDGWRERTAIAAFQHLQRVKDAGALYITIADDRYPFFLRQIADPPFGITVLGDVELLKRPLVGIVGARKASQFALQESEKLAAWYADCGVVTVSGGAFGCDAAAHRGALLSGYKPAPTIAVFAHGLQFQRPVFNRSLFKEMQERGALFFSERLWWQDCRRHDYPVRNRLIAGLVPLLWVMQAGARSGALQTAHRALAEGREVKVLRHDAYDIRALGSERLCEEGAESVTCVSEFIEGFYEDSTDTLVP